MVMVVGVGEQASCRVLDVAEFILGSDDEDADKNVCSSEGERGGKRSFRRCSFGRRVENDSQVVVRIQSDADGELGVVRMNDFKYFLVSVCAKICVTFSSDSILAQVLAKSL